MQDDPGQLEFVRWMNDHDPGYIHGASLWYAPETGEFIFYTRDWMRGSGMATEKARIGRLNNTPTEHAVLETETVEVHKTLDVNTFVGGEAAGWRWSVVEGTVTVDNKPAIEAHDPCDGPHPSLEQARIPLEILEVVVGTALDRR